MTHEELIAALEAATGDDREIDGLIYGSLHDLTPQGSFMTGRSFQFRHPTLMHPGGPASLYVPDGSVPEYTASIDAALTLVPEGLYWLLANGQTRPDEPLGGAQVFRPGAGKPIGEAEAATPAIALCVAALKARQVTP